MKQVIKFVVFCFIGVFAFASCIKEKTTPITNNNQPPVANAGLDQTVTLPTDSIELSGSGTDADGSIVNYNWSRLSGPLSYTILNRNMAKTKVKNLVQGVYVFELKVTDNAGMTSNDIVIISVKAGCTEYDFDITLTSLYYFIKNYYESPWDYGWTSGGSYDYTSIEGKGGFQPFGQFDIYVKQFADTTALSDIVNYNYMRISNGNADLFGHCSINFKKLIMEGGGSLNGTFIITRGWAQGCNANLFTSLSPLTVTGSLDVSTHIVTLRIKGKVYF